MDWSVRELRCFVAAADEGSFTEAAAVLHVSQAAVSRTIAHLEATVGDRLLRRIPRGCELTNAGASLLPHARRVIAEADRFSAFVRSRHGIVRLGYAWAALGRHTTVLQRRWAAAHDDIDLELVRNTSPTAGLLEGRCDVAVLRRPVDDPRIESVVVGLERRLAAFATDDSTWRRRRSLTMADIAQRTVLIDTRGGTTVPTLWDPDHQPPRFIEIGDADAWLDAIAAGRGVGTTAEATALHHARAGVTYRPISDGARIAVQLAWLREERPRGLADLITEVTRLYQE